jgi:predicted glycogen debranching enzyme
MTNATPDEPWPRVAVGRDLRRAGAEWLHTNGAGSYASSTIAGLHTRRYHGLLVAALDPPGARHVILSHVDVTVAPDPDARANGARSSRARWELGKHQFPGVDPERSPFHLDRFDQDPLPRWTYLVGGGRLEITLGLARGENALVLRYAFEGPDPVVLTLRPLLAARHYHALLREHGGMLQRVELRRGPEEGGVAVSEMRVQPRKDLPRVCFRYDGTFVGSPDWWRRFEYLRERDRGLDFEEDLWTPGVFETRLAGAPQHLVVALDRLPSAEPEAMLDATRAALLAEDPGPRAHPIVRRLAVAAEVFRADLARSPGVVAGYPWFETGARETLIALPGLYLVPHRVDAGVAIVRRILDAMRDGVVIDGAPGTPELRSADATLWLFEAARHLADTLGDEHPVVVGELLDALHHAFEAVVRGVEGGPRLTEDGLVAAGSAGSSLTWMDARVDGAPVTPRAGCAIELCALWSRGCDTLGRLAHAASHPALADRAWAARDRARDAFRRFWCDETDYPYDVVPESPGGGEADRTIRPNALLALSLDPACFTATQADAVLARASRDLLTPGGVRSLAPGARGYAGRYQGGVAERDRALHQGSAWPWLIGPFVRAALARGASREPLAHLVASAADRALALGYVAELADGDPPHAPGGAIAQASSVAELLRAATWDLGLRGA